MARRCDPGDQVPDWTRRTQSSFHLPCYRVCSRFYLCSRVGVDLFFACYICGTARQYYSHMHSIGGAAELLCGRAGREFIGIIYYIYVALVAGSAMLTVSVALNGLSSHGILYGIVHDNHGVLYYHRRHLCECPSDVFCGDNS